MSPAHGEYTHRIQWYVICKSRKVDAPAKLVSDLQKFGGADGLPASAAWDALVDRFRFNSTDKLALFKAKDANDFRSPEHFNDYLTDPVTAGRFPLLAAFLSARKQKRDNFNIHDYIAKKVYGKKFDQLTDKEKQDAENRANPTRELGLITTAKRS